jgi:hypothetical protein
VLLITVDSGEGKRLEDRLDRLREFLLVNEEVLRRASASCDADVFIGWSPESQESLTFDASLIQMLTLFQLDLVFDVYGEGSAR